MIGIIGGSGLYKGIEGLQGVESEVKTEFGKVKIIKGNNFVFISRHGNPPKPPHMVNYHANIKAFEILKVKNIVAISSVGSLKRSLAPGTIIMPEDLLDFTFKVWTYHNERPYHVNLYEPFCKNLREKIHKELNIPEGATYATMKGPQFETRAEEKMLRTLGADIVGMTIAPEAKLAKELDLCYQPICVIVNYVDKNTTHQDTLKSMEKYEGRISTIVNELLQRF